MLLLLLVGGHIKCITLYMFFCLVRLNACARIYASIYVYNFVRACTTISNENESSAHMFINELVVILFVSSSLSDSLIRSLTNCCVYWTIAILMRCVFFFSSRLSSLLSFRFFCFVFFWNLLSQISCFHFSSTAICNVLHAHPIQYTICAICLIL